MQTLSGRVKRKASLSVEERNKIKKRKRSKVLDSDDEGITIEREKKIIFKKFY